MHKLVISQYAKTDLLRLKQYLQTKFDKKTCQQTLKNIQRALTRLQQYPYSGHVPDAITGLLPDHFREIIFGKNRILFQIEKKIIYIHCISDIRKNWQTLLMQRLLS